MQLLDVSKTMSPPNLKFLRLSNYNLIGRGEIYWQRTHRVERFLCRLWGGGFSKSRWL